MDRASLSSGFNPIGFHITVLALRPDVEFGLAMWQICSAVNVQTGVDWVLCGFGLPTRFHVPNAPNDCSLIPSYRFRANSCAALADVTGFTAKKCPRTQLTKAGWRTPRCAKQSNPGWRLTSDHLAFAKQHPALSLVGLR